MNSALAERKCIPCSGANAKKLSDEEIAEFHQQVPDWEIVEDDGEKHLRKEFDFKDFRQALEFTYRIGRAADENDHHPTILTEWGKVTVTWWTHKVKGLHQNDFIMAAKTDELREGVSVPGNSEQG